MSESENAPKTTINSEMFVEAAAGIDSYLIEADQVSTLTGCDKHITFLTDEVLRRCRLLDTTEQAKKDVMAGWRDTIKFQKEQLKDSMERLSVMEDRKRVLAHGDSED